MKDVLRSWLDDVSDGLPGRWSASVSDDFPRGDVALRIEQRLDVVGRTYAQVFVLPRLEVDEAPQQALLQHVARRAHAAFRPWERPDPPLLGRFDLFPRLAPFLRRARRHLATW